MKEQSPSRRKTRDPTGATTCDESKCVSQSFEGPDGFWCYGGDTLNSRMMCADGFVPRVVEDEPPRTVRYGRNRPPRGCYDDDDDCFAAAYDDDVADEYATEDNVTDGSVLDDHIMDHDMADGNETRQLFKAAYIPSRYFFDDDEYDGYYSKSFQAQYFTCCPPDDPSSGAQTETEIARHCSDPIESRVKYRSIVCEDQGDQKYPRLTKYTDGNMAVFLCCDSEMASDDNNNNNNKSNNNDNEDNASFLDVVECVPYRNQDYDPGIFDVRNMVGWLHSSIECDLPDFPFPRPIGNESYAEYKVSESAWWNAEFLGPYQCCKTGPAVLFVEDSAFRVTAYTELTVYSVAALASAIVAAGLSIPLLVQWGKRKNQSSTSRRRMSRRRSGISPGYSSFNLYLVYLALPDLAHALYRITINAGYIMQKHTDDFYSNIILFCYVAINLWLNAIVAYQVLVLLKSSRSAQRIDQPSLRRVNIQAGAVYFSLALYATSIFVVYQYPPGRLTWILTGPILILLYSLPIVYVVSVSILVLWHGYLPSSRNAVTARDRGMRLLAVYFFRIIYVFIGVWIPGVILYTIDRFSSYHDAAWAAWAIFVARCIPAVQAIVTTSVVLTKPDVRKHVLDLVTLSYPSCNRNCIVRKKRCMSITIPANETSGETGEKSPANSGTLVTAEMRKTEEFWRSKDISSPTKTTQVASAVGNINTKHEPRQPDPSVVTNHTSNYFMADSDSISNNGDDNSNDGDVEQHELGKSLGYDFPSEEIVFEKEPEP